MFGTKVLKDKDFGDARASTLDLILTLLKKDTRKITKYVGDITVSTVGCVCHVVCTIPVTIHIRMKLILKISPQNICHLIFNPKLHPKASNFFTKLKTLTTTP